MLKNMSLSKKLTLGFASLIVLLLIQIGIGINGMRTMDGNMERIVKVNAIRINHLGEMQTSITGIGTNVRNIIINDSMEKKQEYQQRITKFREEYAKSFKIVEEMTTKTDTKALEIIAKLKEAIITSRTLSNQVIELAMANKDAEAGQLLSKQSAPAERVMLSLLNDLLDHNIKRNELRYNESVAGYHFSRNLMLGIGLVSIVLAILTAMLLIRSVMKQLGADPREVAEVANYVAVGDLSHEIKLASDDTSSVMAAMKKMVAAIQALTADANMLSEAAIAGKLATRADATKHQGDFQKIVDGVNETINRLVGFLDNMPAPAMTIDKDFTILYMNELGAKVGGKTQQQVAGTKCYDHFKTSDCNTQQCACGRAMSNGQPASSETDAHPGGLDLDIAYTGVPITDRNGNIIGAFEVVSDQTAVKKAARVAEKQARYQNNEVGKLLMNLEKWRWAS